MNKYIPCVLTELEARRKIAKLIRAKPSLHNYQAIVNKKLSSCETFEEKIKTLFTMITENHLKIIDSLSDLNQILKKVNKIE